MQRLTYKEKLELSYKGNIISRKSYNFLDKLNSLRNQCAHHWFLKGKRMKLLYKGKDVLKINNFRELAKDIFTLHKELWGV
jgi:abortive infection bacteriophage resistance protein